MTNFTPEMIEKAKAAKSADELLALAKENSIELTEEEAKACFYRLNSKSSELSDDELGNVAGGTWGYGGNIPLSNGGEKSFRAVPALNQCPTCGAMYPMNDICPNCVREAPAIEQ